MYLSIGHWKLIEPALPTKRSLRQEVQSVWPHSGIMRGALRFVSNLKEHILQNDSSLSI